MISAILSFFSAFDFLSTLISRGKRHSETPKTPVLQTVLPYSERYSGRYSDNLDCISEQSTAQCSLEHRSEYRSTVPSEFRSIARSTGVRFGVPEYGLEYRSIGVPEYRFSFDITTTDLLSIIISLNKETKFLNNSRYISN